MLRLRGTREMVSKALAVVIVIATLNQRSIGANFRDYYPLTPQTHGIKTFEWTYGGVGTTTSIVAENETVSYGDGTEIIGTYINNDFYGSDFLASDLGTGIQVLGDRDVYFAEDPDLMHPPAAWFWGEFSDGYLLDQETCYDIDKS